MRAELLEILREEVLKGIAGGWEKFTKRRSTLAAAFPNEIVCSDLELLTFLKDNDLSNVLPEIYSDIKLILILLPKNNELKELFADKFLHIYWSTKDYKKRLTAYITAKNLDTQKTQDLIPNYKIIESEFFNSLTDKTDDIFLLVLLVNMHINGIGTEKNSSKKFELCRLAADRGSAPLQYTLGNFYEIGECTTKDEGLATASYQKAAEQGLAIAQYWLGLRYFRGKGIQADKKKAAFWLKKAAYQGRALAYFELGRLYASGEGLAKDEAQAMECYRKAAEERHADAQLCLGRYHMAKGNFEEAAKWRSKTAIAEDAQSCTDIATLAKHGVLLAVHTLGSLCLRDGNSQTAAELFKFAAEKGFAEAQVDFGACHYKGEGVLRKDMKMAEHWFKKAALPAFPGDKGNKRAQYYLSLLYREGQICAANHIEANRWLLKAAEQDHVEAQYSLAQVFESGLGGIIKDEKRAAEWYRKSAERGCAQAQFCLGKIYQSGKGGLDRNENMAAGYFRNAAKQGLIYAKISFSCWLKSNGSIEAANEYSPTQDESKDVTVKEILSYAECGFDISKFSIVIMNRDGTRTQKDGIHATRWLGSAGILQQDARSLQMLNKLNDSCVSSLTLKR